MDSLKKMILAAGTALALASGAHAAGLGNASIAGLAVPTMTYTTLAQAQTLSRTSGYSGVGSLFVSTKSTATTGFGYLCTGSLLNSTTVLTAAHCLYDHDEEGNYDPVTGITFYLPSFGERKSSTVETFTANAYAFNPDYGGDIGSGHDVSLFTLSRAATGHDTYSLYNGDPLQEYTEVGTGTIGGPQGQSVGITDDFEKRVGTNIFEDYGDDLFSDVTHGVVFSDFDDGTAQHDVFGRIGDQLEDALGDRLGYNRQTGVPGGDANSSQGDSGGPEFIDGKIVSVTSFGITGGIFNDIFSDDPNSAYCGGDAIDAYNSSGSNVKTSIGHCTNSSVGELAGDTLTSYNSGFINDYLNGNARTTALPEPANWALMLIGFGAVGGAMRRRSVRVAFAG